MFNAEEIIELEKKWLKYKIKQKSKFYVLSTILLLAISFITYQMYFVPKTKTVKNVVSKKITKKPIEKKTAIKQVKTIAPKELNNTTKSIVVNEKNGTVKKEVSKDTNKTVVTIDKPKVEAKQKIVLAKKEINKKPYYFKLEPTEQGSGLFSSNGFLTLNIPFQEKQKVIAKEQTQEIVQPIRKMQENASVNVQKKKPNISIDMQEVDTISYLKDKYYSTSSIVFALMLAEEYYYDKKYKDSLKWALTANDIDAQNTKSWYWFAKAKVKLNQKEDALRALRAYLSNNSSKRLSTLLHKIELGDTDD